VETPELWPFMSAKDSGLAVKEEGVTQAWLVFPSDPGGGFSPCSLSYKEGRRW